MENGDTIEVSADLSACMYAGGEKYTFTKQNDSIFLQTFSEERSFERKSQTLSKIFYSINPEDSLSFENYFKFLNKNDVPKREYSRALITVNYGNTSQVKYFYDSGLEDKFKKLDRLHLIRKKIYPKDSFFKVEEPPPPPPRKK